MQIKLTSATDSQEVNILGLSKDELLSLILDFETQPKRASMRVNQLWSWIYCHGISSFDNMTNIDKSLRSKLQKVFNISRPAIEKKEISDDGTIKYLFCLEDQSKIETVFIPEEKRSTLCISSQVGCTLNCSFCHTGTQKLVRNLTSQEIVGQVIAVYDDLDLWKKMGAADQALFEMACTAAAMRAITTGEFLQGKQIQSFPGKGVTAARLPDSVLRELQKVSARVMKEESAKDADFAKVWASQQAFMKEYDVWQKWGYLPRNF